MAMKQAVYFSLGTPQMYSRSKLRASVSPFINQMSSINDGIEEYFFSWLIRGNPSVRLMLIFSTKLEMVALFLISLLLPLVRILLTNSKQDLSIEFPSKVRMIGSIHLLGLAIYYKQIAHIHHQLRVQVLVERTSQYIGSSQ